jgi:hypothetical protein
VLVHRAEAVGRVSNFKTKNEKPHSCDILKFKISYTCANCVERHKFDKFKLDTDIQWKETKNTIETLDVKTHNWLKNVKVEINSVPKEIIDWKN